MPIGKPGEPGQPGEEGTATRGGRGGIGGRGGHGGTSRGIDYTLLMIAVMIAASFGWLFYQQQQRSSDNRRNIMLATRVAYEGCLADRRQELTLRFVLATLRDRVLGPQSPDEYAARIALYNGLLRHVPVRNCAREFAPLAAQKIVTTSPKGKP